jgi:hypothetical protein
MLLPQAEINKLSDDAYARIEVFFRSFCEGSLRRHYGLGHLVYACHAAFPLALTPELANLIWVNFKHFPYQDDTAGKIDAIAVSDFLLSPLCQPISYQQYEVIPQVRSYLLHLLNDGSWFRRYGIAIDGTERLQQLADFLQQYVKQKQSSPGLESTGFKQLNEWAALAYLNPQELAGRIGDALEDSISSNQRQLWVNAQMERFDKQFSYNVHHHNGNKEILRPFLNLYHYTQARKNDIFNRDNDKITGDSFKISSIPTGDGLGRIISMPLSKAIADRTNRRINKVQRVISLLIGVDEYKDSKFGLKGCVYGAKQVAALLQQLNSKDPETSKEGYDTDTVFELYNGEATAANIFETVRKLFSLANPEDICLIYFSGHGENGSYTENTLIPADYGSSNSGVITNHDFFNAIQTAKARTRCKVMLIVDSHTGYYNWVEPEDVFIGAVRHTMQTEQPFNGENVASAFLLALRDIIRVTNGKITYRHLLRWLRFKIEEDYNVKEQTPVLQTITANLDNYFLRTDLNNADDAPVIVFHKASNTWRVLNEDFKVLTLNTTTYVRDYETNELVPDVRGELFLRERVIYFGGRIEGLEEDRLYKAESTRPQLVVQVLGSVTDKADKEKVAAEITSCKFDCISLWGAINPRIGINLSKERPHFAMSVDVGASRYQVSFINTDSGKEQLNSWIFPRHFPLVDFLQKLARYYYLINLTLPKDHDVLYDPLSVTMFCSWDGDSKASEPLSQQPVLLNEEALLINEGTIAIRSLIVQVINQDTFPVFCHLYLVVSDLTIQKIATVTPGMPLMSGGFFDISIERGLIESMLVKGLTGRLVLLVSRDPHQIDFSQKGVEQQ